MSHFKPLCDCFVQLILWYRQQNCLDRLHNTLFNCLLITAISERQTGHIVFQMICLFRHARVPVLRYIPNFIYFLRPPMG